MRQPAGGRKARVPKARHWFLGHPRNMREPITIRIRYRGGAEAWWEIEARGQTLRRPGHVAIHDLFREINGES